MGASSLMDIVFIGAGATLVMDIWAWTQARVLGIPSLNYALIGRWVVMMKKGQFVQQTIFSVEKVKGEQLLGWFLHYLIGIIFALVHLVVWGEAWIQSPSVVSALITGWVTLAFPLFIVQPCLGFGFAASKTQDPSKARLLSLLAHTAYGIGLYVSALVLAYAN
ncbi:DUF2938 domain-containing protein [Vibrio ulleungensis]|uniref:DUF2938 domain-containing protein n=1 Tax=Vibrio ulleungensis TaxID=2807619 RepID=A0ABS2HM13_9VIBR|nr:DUF2938 domain-containing protein [Vibrio ulleungensis]MBM7037253.1 DUF2938 domain-containing protein [Vibrio ulleungensis]